MPDGGRQVVLATGSPALRLPGASASGADYSQARFPHARPYDADIRCLLYLMALALRDSRSTPPCRTAAFSPGRTSFGSYGSSRRTRRAAACFKAARGTSVQGGITCDFAYAIGSLSGSRSGCCWRPRRSISRTTRSPQNMTSYQADQAAGRLTVTRIEWMNPHAITST